MRTRSRKVGELLENNGQKKQKSRLSNSLEEDGVGTRWHPFPIASWELMDGGASDSRDRLPKPLFY